MSGLKAGAVGALLGAVAAALLSPLFEPALKRFGTDMADALFPPASPVKVMACAPLKVSRTVLSVSTPNGSRVIADGPHHMRNETLIYVENTSSMPIKNATLTAYPLAFGKEPATLSLAEVWFTSIRGSADGRPVYHESGNYFELAIPQLNPREAVLLSQTYAVPVGFIVEVYADGLSEKKLFQPGCPQEIAVRDTLEPTAFDYVGPNCTVEPKHTDSGGQGHSKCVFEDNISIKITEEMKGQDLGREEVVVEDPHRVIVPVLRERMRK